jgi:hypothetical protein
MGNNFKHNIYIIIIEDGIFSIYFSWYFMDIVTQNILSIIAFPYFTQNHCITQILLAKN